MRMTLHIPLLKTRELPSVLCENEYCQGNNNVIRATHFVLKHTFEKLQTKNYCAMSDLYFVTRVIAPWPVRILPK